MSEPNEKKKPGPKSDGTIQTALKVSPQFKKWLRMEKARLGVYSAELLDDIALRYIVSKRKEGQSPADWPVDREA